MPNVDDFVLRLNSRMNSYANNPKSLKTKGLSYIDRFIQVYKETVIEILVEASIAYRGDWSPNNGGARMGGGVEMASMTRAQRKSFREQQPGMFEKILEDHIDSVDLSAHVTGKVETKEQSRANICFIIQGIIREAGADRLLNELFNFFNAPAGV